MKHKSILAALILGAGMQLAAQAPAEQPTSRVVEDGGSGMYPAIMMSETSLSTHTVFRPQDLKQFDSNNKLPILVWGNGGCAKSPSGHINFLSEIASHGFIVIAIGPMPQANQGPAPGQGGPGGPGMGQGGRPPMGQGAPGQMGQGGGRPPMGQGGPGGQMGQGGGRPPMGQGGPGGQMGQGGGRPAPQAGQAGGASQQPTETDLTKAINWAIAQNADKNSPYYNKLDVAKIAAAGMSCGGLEALDIAHDPRLSTVMVCNSGIVIGGGGSMGGTNVTKEQLKRVHTPIIYLLGGESDIAYANGMDDFKLLEKVPAFVANMNVGHGGTYMQPHGGEFAKVATAWLKWHLKGDNEASKLFKGNPAGLASNSNWVFEKKNID